MPPVRQCLPIGPPEQGGRIPRLPGEILWIQGEPPYKFLGERRSNTPLNGELVAQEGAVRRRLSVTGHGA